MAKQYYATSSLVIGYALCSSLLAIINKYAVTKFGYPALLTALQYLTSAGGVWILGKLGFLCHDPFNLENAKKFAPAAIVFYLAIFTNTNLLYHANVDTFIVFRSLTPLLVAIADTAFRKQPCPSKLTFLSLVVILGGAVGYVITDSAFSLTAYSWALAYLYKSLFTAIESRGERWFQVDAFVAVALSCVFGLLISFFGFATRKAISATAFTVTGVVNKFLTVAINVLIWDKHSSPFGLICLLFTIAGGVLYQQSVTKKGITAPQHEPESSEQTKDDDEGIELDEEKQSLVPTSKSSNA
uniref:Uncharacterized protein n=1 Tax=Oryza glumipatula TaxID=40148 RepID=A0A0E0B183_9ORYZ